MVELEPLPIGLMLGLYRTEKERKPNLLLQ
jgi:hypothetical protein